MSTALDEPLTPHPEPPTDTRCRVATLYEDTAARTRATRLADRLVADFWEDVEFDFSWWRFGYLADPTVAESAASAAGQSDVVIVSASVEGTAPRELVEWFRQWIPIRATHPGLLVPLLEAVPLEVVRGSDWWGLLEEVARRTGMEFLHPSQLHESGVFPGPAGLLQQRATQVTGILNDILSQRGRPPAPPSHWGINE